MSDKKLTYPQQDAEELGEFYFRHLDAMTTERLHSKSDIAAQLAWRDRELERLRQVKPRTLYIILEGGLVQNVCADDPTDFAGIDVRIIDYDIEGADADEITQVQQPDGGRIRP